MTASPPCHCIQPGLSTQGAWSCGAGLWMLQPGRPEVLAMALCWFLPCRPEALGVARGVTCTAQEPLSPRCPPLQGYQPWVPQAWGQVPRLVLIQVEPPRRGPATPPARLPTAQEVCYRRAQQAQRESASWLQAAPLQPEKVASVHISAPGEKRRIAHVPNPRLATGKSP